MFTPLAYVGEDIAGYAARNHTIDSRVGDVGRAIFEAGTKGIPPQVMRADYNGCWNTRHTADERTVDPDAAADWFNGCPPVSMSSDGYRGHTRLQDLIVYNRLHGHGWSGDLARAMDRAIGAAARGSASTSRSTTSPSRGRPARSDARPG